MSLFWLVSQNGVKRSWSSNPRGKRLALRVSNQAPYYDVCDKAAEKWSSVCYKKGEGYTLHFEDRKSGKTFSWPIWVFHQEEIGKECKRIVLYLGTEEGYKLSTGEYTSEEGESGCGDEKEPPQKQSKLDQYLETQVQDDEKFAKNLHKQFDKEEFLEGTTETNKLHSAVFADLESALKSFERQVDQNSQCFLVVQPMAAKSHKKITKVEQWPKNS